MDEIVNKVKDLDVITIDVKDFYTQGTREKFNVSDFLEDGVLIEKTFRKKLMDFDWQIYSNTFSSF